MGTPDFAVPPLKALIKHHNVVAVFTQPDKPKGRGMALKMSDVKQVAVQNGIDVYQPVKIREDKEAIDTIKKLNPDAIVVAAFGQIITESILNIPKYGCINIHASLLPELRGAAPINWAIINGFKKTGISIMQMDKGIDTGDVMLQQEITIRDDETAGELYDELKYIGADLIIKVLNELESGKIKKIKQDDSKFTYAHQIKKELGHINWEDSCENIYNLIRGLNPAPGTYSIYKDSKLKIWKAKTGEDIESHTPGEIIDVSKNGIVVKCGKGSILIDEIQYNGSKRMTVQAYLNGHHIETGAILK